MGTRLRSERGLVSVYVFVTMMFSIMVLGGIFSASSTLRKSQLKYNVKIKQIYEQDVNQINAIYENISI